MWGREKEARSSIQWGSGSKPERDHFCLRLRFSTHTWLVWTCRADTGEFWTDYSSPWVSSWGTTNDPLYPICRTVAMEPGTAVDPNSQIHLEEWLFSNLRLDPLTAAIRASELVELARNLDTQVLGPHRLDQRDWHRHLHDKGDWAGARTSWRRTRKATVAALSNFEAWALLASQNPTSPETSTTA